MKYQFIKSFPRSINPNDSKESFLILKKDNIILTQIRVFKNSLISYILYIVY